MIAQAKDHPSGLVVRAADLSQSRPPRWAWLHWIALGYFNLLIGVEGVGKGTLAAWLLARLTHGDLPGDLRGEPVNVAIVSYEDSFSDTWVPRLHAAGADLKRVFHLERPDGGYLELGADRERLKLVIDLENVRVVFLDQLLDNLPVRTDDYKTSDVRRALAPLMSLVREWDVAAIGSMHPNKRAQTFRQLVAGASAFNAISRSSLLLGEHPDDDERRVLVRGKGNLSKKPAAREFEIQEHTFGANGHTFDVPIAANFGECDLDVEDLLEPPSPRPAGEARTSARDVIAGRLDDGEWHPAAPILDELERAGVYSRAARRAAKDLGVSIDRRGFPASAWWRLSGHSSSRVLTVQSVPTVRTAAMDGQASLYASLDSEDSADSGYTCTTVSTPGNAIVADCFDGEDETAFRAAEKALGDQCTDALAAPKCSCEDPALAQETPDDPLRCALCGRDAP